MAAKKRTGKFVAPKDEAKNASSDDYSSAGSGDDDDFAFYQSRFPLPTSAPKPVQPTRRPAASLSQPAAQQPRQSEEWVEVHDTRKDKYQQRRTAREAELAALQAEAEENRRNEFATLPRFVPYVRDASGKWLGGKSTHKPKPKQVGVIEEYIIPDASSHNAKHKKKKNTDLLTNTSSTSSSSGGSREWSSEADMVDSIVSWIERQLGDEAMTVAAIGEKIQARTGESWKQRYKPHYGPLVDWLASQPRLAVHNDRVTVRPPPPQADDTADAQQQQRQQQRERERRERAQRAETAAAVRVVSRAERSWLAFVLYVLALLLVGYGAYSVWSGRNMSDLARQLSEQLEAMEAKVVDAAHAVASEHST